MININNKPWSKLRSTDIQKFSSGTEDENFFFEFKADEETPAKLVKEISAFANTYALRSAYDIIVTKDGDKEKFKVILNTLTNLYEASKPEIFEKNWSNEKFAPLDKMRKFVYQFREEAYHFNLLNDGKGNFAVCASKVVDLNKLFFATKDVEAHGYVNTLVYQTAFDEIESELEKFRCQIYKAKYVPVKASPISGMMRYFGEDSETKGTDE